MSSLFTGGPLDGQTFEVDQINVLAQFWPMSTESGLRTFLLMPPLAECTRILRGEIKKEQAEGPLHRYETIFLPGGGVEYRDASGGEFEIALRARSQPLSPEAKSRKREFGELADQFINRLRAATILGSTEVSILYTCVDQQGNLVPPIRQSITSRTSVLIPGDPSRARRLAEEIHLDTLIENVNSLVRNAPTDFMQSPGYEGRMLQIQSFSLEIEQA